MQVVNSVFNQKVDFQDQELKKYFQKFLQINSAACNSENDYCMQAVNPVFNQKADFLDKQF